MFELQHLDEEFNVDQAPGSPFQVAAGPVSSMRCRIWRIVSASAGVHRCSKAASPTAAIAAFAPAASRKPPVPCTGLTLPELAAAVAEIADQFVQAVRQRAALARGTQPGIDFVQPAVGAQVAGGLDNALRQFAEEMLIRGCSGRAGTGAGPRCVRPPRRGRRCPGRYDNSSLGRRTCRGPTRPCARLPRAEALPDGLGRTWPRALVLPRGDLRQQRRQCRETAPVVA